MGSSVSRTAAIIEKTEVPPLPKPEVRTLTAKWDGAEVKRALDETVARFILEAGHEEDTSVSNAKVVLGLATCCVALVAQFYPTPFPQNFWLLVACVLAYFTLNTLLQLFVHFRERDVILATRPKSPATAGLALSSSLPRYTDSYTLTLRDAGQTRPPVVLVRSVAAWIFEDGDIDLPRLRADTLRLLENFEQAAHKEE